MSEGRIMNKSQLPPTEKQLDYCMIILERIGECPCDEDGTPCFEKSMEAANLFIQKNRQLPWGQDSQTSAADWGGIPNH